MGKICDICGKPSGFMPYCNECKSKHELAKCDNCGKWFIKSQGCACQQASKTVKSKESTPPPKKSGESELNCIICGKPSNGKHFCLQCYNKYKDRSIDLRITHCTESQILDAYGNRDNKTKNGLYVRSAQEKIIADELFDQNIRFAYEQTVVCKDSDGKVVELHPDFLLPDYNLVIEHWGYQDSGDVKYLQTKAYKQPLYKQKGYKLAGTTSKDIKDIHAAIERILLENT